MHTNHFQVKSFITSSWTVFKQHKKFIFLAGIATFVINILLQIIQSNSGTLGALFATFISILMMIGWTKVFLGLTRSESVTWNTFKSEPSVWLRVIKSYLWYILYSIGYGIVAVIIPALIVLIGFLTSLDWMIVTGVILGSTALVLVMVYLGIRYQFLKFVALEHADMRSRDIFKKSGAYTKGYLVKLFLLGVVLGLINLLGLICLVIGLFVTIPLTKLAQTKAYEFLKSKHTA